MWKSNNIYIPLCLVLNLLLCWPVRERAIRGQNDFAQLYAGATLAGTSELYSREANLRIIGNNTGVLMQSVVYTRPPFYASLLKPLAKLPYLVAYTIFSFATISSLIWFLWRFTREVTLLPVIMSMSLPSFVAICGGQDTPLLLPIIGGSILLARSNRDLAAGLLLSLVAIKFHLFLFLPLLLLFRRRWLMCLGGLLGTVLLNALGILVAGADSYRQYILVLRDPWINFGIESMPNLHGMVSAINGGIAMEVALTALVVVAFGWMIRSRMNFDSMFSLSIICGLLVCFHSGVADLVLLLPAFLGIMTAATFQPLKGAATLILTPLPNFMALAGLPFSAFVPAGMLIIVALFCVASVRNAPVPKAEDQTPALAEAHTTS